MMTLTLTRVETEAQFAAVKRLLDQMRAWDIATTQSVSGIDATKIIESYYPEDAGQVRQAFGRPGAAMFLAQGGDGQALGCLGYGPAGLTDAPRTGEVQKFYVQSAARGQGAGRALLRAVLRQMPAAGYDRAVLETARFMQSAIALYRAEGFAPCPPFRPALDDLSLFFARSLVD
jgi:ribosomal protein S18 acetylase RimI-like enzyme